MVPPFVSFDATEDAMEDSGPGMATPEHWSDVGPLRGRLGVVEQQLQAVQGQVSALGSQMAVMGQSLRQVEIQLMLQRQQHEDLMKLLVSQATSGAKKARPGPRERQRLREANQSVVHTPEMFTASEPDAPSTCPAHPESEPVEPLEPLEPVPEQVPEPVAPVAVPAVRPISSSPDHGEMAKPVAGGARSAHRRMSWCFVTLMWLLYLIRDVQWPEQSLTDITEEAFDPELNAELTSNPWEARTEDARRLRELGHLRLSVSDCVGAVNLFAQAEHLANRSLGLEESRALRQDHGFALACALRFREAVDVLQEDAMELPVHLLNALGFAHFHLTEVVEAAYYWQQALQLAPENPVLWNNLGAAQVLLGRPAEAALMTAQELAQQLSTGTTYYLQLISSNLHTQRSHRGGLRVEIYNCVASDISAMISGTPAVKLQQPLDRSRQYKHLEMDGALGVDASSVGETLQAVLSTQGEHLLCP
ncbi:unnamed protein product [Durusdinium trenchii]|uniref:Peroxin-5 n=1 Tax=Durusdinium trenchii TaxID=1381693 RepID=A0ABP0JMX5_9DINO